MDLRKKTLRMRRPPIVAAPRCRRLLAIFCRLHEAASNPIHIRCSIHSFSMTTPWTDPGRLESVSLSPMIQTNHLVLLPGNEDEPLRLRKRIQLSMSPFLMEPLQAMSRVAVKAQTGSALVLGGR